MTSGYDTDEWQEYCGDDDNGAEDDELEGFHCLGPKMGGVYPVDGAVKMTLRMVID